MRPLVIAIDGPAGSGKSTLAHALADWLRLPFLDTGLLYRAVGRRLLDAGSPLDDPETALAAALALTPEEVVADRLKGEVIGQAASKVGAMEPVRAALLPFQRAFAARPPGAVLAGRDTGTVVCPDATVKLFVTASVEERARRRHEELRRRGEAITFEAVLMEMRQRDRRDADRAVAPLRIAKDARVLDTNELDVGAALAAARAEIEAVVGGRDGTPLT